MTPQSIIPKVDRKTIVETQTTFGDFLTIDCYSGTDKIVRQEGVPSQKAAFRNAGKSKNVAKSLQSHRYFGKTR